MGTTQVGVEIASLQEYVNKLFSLCYYWLIAKLRQQEYKLSTLLRYQKITAVKI